MRVGMVSTRFAGLDGVSLEAVKVAAVLERLGHEVVWFAGELGPEFAPGIEVPSAHFSDVTELSRQAEYFGTTLRRDGLLPEVRTAAEVITTQLRRFVERFEVDALMPQNALAIPMQIPLAIALSDVASSGVPMVAHHHDMAWERERFFPTAIGDLLDAHFPPRNPLIRHVVINSITQTELARRRGLNSAVLPNVMDFGSPVHQGDAVRFRAAAGLEPHQVVLLQPTRVIPRKSIETSIDLARQIDHAVVVITHEEGDEGDRYGNYLRNHAATLQVDLRFVPVGGDPDRPSLADAYAAADLVTYPSRIEGFGNALLEAFYYQRPVLVRRYPVYAADVAPTGVQCIEIADHLTPEVVDQARSWVGDPASWLPAVEHNFEVGRRHFSLEVAERILGATFEALEA